MDWDKVQFGVDIATSVSILGAALLFVWANARESKRKRAERTAMSGIESYRILIDVLVGLEEKKQRLALTERLDLLWSPEGGAFFNSPQAEKRALKRRMDFGIEAMGALSGLIVRMGSTYTNATAIDNLEIMHNKVAGFLMSHYVELSGGEEFKPERHGSITYPNPYGLLVPLTEETLRPFKDWRSFHIDFDPRFMNLQHLDIHWTEFNEKQDADRGKKRGPVQKLKDWARKPS